jgi:hypothetical protein
MVASISPTQPGHSTPRLAIKRPSSTGVGIRHSAHRTAGPVTVTSGSRVDSAPSVISVVVDKRVSSLMMSLQTSTHSSQMNTEGPAMSLPTSFCDFLQNEHRNGSCALAVASRWSFFLNIGERDAKMKPDRTCFLGSAKNQFLCVSVTLWPVITESCREWMVCSSSTSPKA